jgi:hypothetical protein
MTDTVDSINQIVSVDDLAALTLAIQDRINALKLWLSEAKTRAAAGHGYAPRDVFRAKEAELRDVGKLMAAVNERRGALKRAAFAVRQAREPAKETAKVESPRLLDTALTLLFDLYNESYEDRFVEMLHTADCLRDTRCKCKHARTFDMLMHAGGWSARATSPSNHEAAVAPGCA